MAYTYYFEKLKVWQEARVFVKIVYEATSEFSNDEKYGMRSQLRRSAVSIPSNLAEGSARSSRKDQAHFTMMAYSSLMELLTQFILSEDMGLITEEMLASIRINVDSIAQKLIALRKAQLASPN